MDGQPAISAVQAPAGPACPFPAWAPPIGIRLTVLPEHPCSYLPGRMARSRSFWAEEMPPEVYQRFMNAGFRRSGKLVYQPICTGCRECLPIRVPVAIFRPSKSQRRCFRRNSDLRIEQAAPVPTGEKFELYRAYLKGWHGGELHDYDDFVRFLYESPVNTVEFSYRDASGRLIAIGICDVCSTSLSSVYFYFDPAQSKRALGTFGALCEIQYAKVSQIPYYYLGYWVEHCSAMAYKDFYRPNEVLHADARWERRGADEKGQAQ